jgi:hypothetical protein
MQLTSTLRRPLISSRVILDWSHLSPESSAHASPEVDTLLDWVRTYPRRTDIHVYLRNSMRSIGVRKLQHKLQALGCTVTTTCYREGVGCETQ